MTDTPAQAIAKQMIGRFPITAAPTGANVGGGSYDVLCKEFKIFLNRVAPSDDQIGRYDALIHLHNGETLTGFKGACYYKFLDERGNIVFAMLGDVYGMSAKGLPASPSEADKNETKSIPLYILTAVHGVEIVPVRAEDNMVDNLKHTVEELTRGAEVVRDGLVKIGATVVEIAAAIKAL